MNQEQSKEQNKILTIPNLLSILRICMIPLFVWMYRSKQDYRAAALILLLSGLTDVADGYISRHFHMVSNLGKIIDPVADKLTQAAMLLCLAARFPIMFFLLALLALKEITTGIAALIVIKCTRTVRGADWHGKLTTLMLYSMMILHLLWTNITSAASNLSILSCVVMMLISYALYGGRIARELSVWKKENQSTNHNILND